MHARGVERVRAARDAHEARRVEIGLRPQLGHLLELPAVGERAVGLAVRHDVLGDRRRDAGDVPQQARARGVHVDAHAVDHVLDHVAQRAAELALVEVVLVLANADGLGRDLDQFRQRVLQAAAQAHRAARGHVEVGVFLARQLGGRVHRCARLVHDGVAQLGCGLGDERRHNLLGLAARRAVAHHDGVDAVLAREAQQLALGSRDIASRGRGVQDGVVEELAVLVQHGDLAARPVTGVERDHAGTTDGTLLQQALGVLGEDLDGVLLRAHGEVHAQLALERGCHEALVSVGDGSVELPRERPATTRVPALQALGRGLTVHAHAHAQLALTLTAIDGEDTVVGDGPGRLGELVIGLVRGLLVRIDGLRLDGGRLMRVLAQVRRVLGILRHELRHDVARAGERRLRRGEAALGVDVARGRRERTLPLHGLHENEVRERLEAGVTRLRRAGGPLLAERLVEVLNALERGRLLDALAELVRELALAVDHRDDVGLALLEVAQVGQAVVKRTQRDVIHTARGLLAVAGDEGDRRALIDEGDDGLDARDRLPQLCGERGHDALVHGGDVLRGGFCAPRCRGIRQVIGREGACGTQGAHRARRSCSRCSERCGRDGCSGRDDRARPNR